jgi:phosphoribosylformylglycinamidine cyclo-ligase
VPTFYDRFSRSETFYKRFSGCFSRIEAGEAVDARVATTESFLAGPCGRSDVTTGSTLRTDGGADPDADDAEELTYAETGVDIDASEAATAALVAAAGDAGSGDYAGLLDIGDRYLALATDGVGTKLLVAEALGDYSTVGIDCVAMNVNDMVAAGVRPVAFVDYLAVDEPDETFSAQVGEGLSAGAEAADIELVGGETAVMPEVVRGLDLAGTCAGLAGKDALFPGEARAGDAVVGFRSSGIHSNGLTLARSAATRRHAYTDPYPLSDADEYEDEPDYDSVGAALLEPTRIYSHLLDPMRAHGVHAAAHITGGGWTNLTRMGSFRYVIDDPFDAHSVFAFVQREGNVSDEEMHRTFNMGTGFVCTLPPEDAAALVDATEGRIVGHVEACDDDDAGVSIRGLELS